MESSLKWLNEEEGLLTVSEQGTEKMRFRVFVLGEEEAELKLEKTGIVETTEKIEKICTKVILEMTKCIQECFLQMWNEGFEETSLVEQSGTDIAQILDSIPVVKHVYSECMMRRCFAQNQSFACNSDKLKLIENEDSIICKNADETFFCRLLPYTTQQEEERSFYLCEVEVEEKKRNTGIATACLNELFGQLAKDAPVTIYLQVGSYNEPAVHLYEKLGFETAEELCYYVAEEEEAE